MPNQVQATNYAAAVEYAKQAALSLDQGDQDEYAKTLGKLAGAIPDLKGRQRATLLGQTDPRVLEALKETDELKKDARLIQALDRALGQQDSRHLGNAAEAKQDAQTVQATRWGSSQAEMVIQLAGQLGAAKAAGHMRRPKKTEGKKIDAARQDPNDEGAVVYKRLIAFLEDISGAGEPEGIANARDQLAKAENVLKNRKATARQKAQARKSKTAAKKSIEAFEEVRDRAGFILGEPTKVGQEFLAHMCGLPSRLSKAQKAAAGSIDRDALLASLGPADSKPRQLADKMIEARSGDPTAQRDVETMVADMVGLDPELQELSPTVRNRLAQLREQNPEGYKIISEHLIGQERSQQNAKRCYHEIMGLINSGLPIESVIMLVMILLAEREEEKFNDKVKELTAYEQIDKMNAGTEQTIETLKQIDRTDPSGFQNAKAELQGQIEALDADGGVDALKTQLTEHGTALKAEREAAAAAGPSKEGEVRKLDQRIAANDERLALLDTPNGREELLGKLKSDLALVNRHGTSLVAAREIGEHEANKVDPKDFGLKQKSSTIVMQELQVQMQMYMQVMQALAAVLRQIQDLVMTPVHNIR